MKFDIWFETAALLYLLFLTFHSYINRAFSNRIGRLFNQYIIVSIVDIVSNILSSVFISFPDMVPPWVNWITSQVFFFSQFLLGVCFFIYILMYTGIERNRPLLKALLMLDLLALVCILFNPLTKWFFYFDSKMIYYHGFGYPILLVITVINLFGAIILAIKKRNQMEGLKLLDLVYHVTLLLTLLSVQLIFSSVLLSGVAIVLITFSIYISLQNPQDNRDFLTKTYTRKSLNVFLKEAIEDKRSYPIVFLDIRHTHVFNKAFGENAGNSLIRAIALNLSKHDRRSIVFRYTGDSFMIVLPNQKKVQDIVQEYQKVINQTVMINGSNFTAELQGFCFAHMDKFKDAESLIAALEHSIYKAKAAEEESLLVIDDNIMEDVNRRKRIEVAINQSIDNKDVKVVLEPYYCVKDKSYDYALAHMGIKGLEDFQESEINEIADNAGLSSSLSSILLEKVLCYLASPDCRFKSITVKIPLSDCLKVDFASEVGKLLDSTRADASKLVFAITETMATVSPTIENTMKNLRDRNVGFVCDNFGVGYADLEKITKLPFRSAGLDPELVCLISNPRERAVVFRLVALLKEFGYNVAAKGFFTPEDIQTAIDLGIDFIVEEGYTCHPIIV